MILCLAPVLNSFVYVVSIIEFERVDNIDKEAFTGIIQPMQF